MRKITKIIGMVTLILTLASCNKWFDVNSSTTVKEEELFKNQQGFEDVFTGIYTLLTTEGLYGRELTYGYNDIRAKYWNVTKSDHNYYKAMSLNYTDATEVSRINVFWNRLYKAVSNVNAILANIDRDTTLFSPGNYALYKGEAYGLRAMLHFELLRLYGVSPAAADAAQTPVIPYYESLTNSAQPLLTQEQILTKIRTDLTAARTLMRPWDPFGPHYTRYSDDELSAYNRGIHLNYWAATALLARVELYAGNKEAALAAAREIVGNPGDAPVAPFTINALNSENQRLFSTELIFALDIKTLEDMTDKLFGEKVATTTSTQGILMRTRDFNSLFTLVNAGDMEYRKTLWLKSIDEDYYTLSKFTAQKRLPMIRLSEMYYIAAECSASAQTGLSYLNQARGGRGLAPLPSTAVLSNELRTEYQREFIGEGQTFYYFKRLGTVSSVGLLKKAVTLAQYRLPYPTTEIEFGKVEQ